MAKPQVSIVEEEGDFDGQVIPMTLDADSMPEVLSLLTHLYKDPELACIREISTNARDSHLEANNPAPIEILTPNALAPNFVVRDWGMGLSLDEIENIYSKYGASTKRQDDRLTGTLGMGCKSPLAYCGQFTMRAVKNGWLTTAQIGRVQSSSAAITILSHVETDEPNGVEITIPRMDLGDFDRKVTNFFRYWRDGEVLINGQPPKPLEGRRLGTEIILQDRPRAYNDDQSDVVVMGGVPYLLDPKYRLYDPSSTTNHQRAVTVVCYVKMGSVTFVPSREGLQYTTHTRQTLKKLSLEVMGRIKHLIEKDLAEAPTHWDALLAHHKWRNQVGYMIPGAQYRGEDIPIKFGTVADGNTFTRHSNWQKSGGRTNYYPAHNMTIEQLLEYHVEDLDSEPRIVVGAPADKKSDAYRDSGFRYTLKTTSKLRIRNWSIDHNVIKALVLPYHPDVRWLRGLRTVDWPRVLESKPPRDNDGKTVYTIPDINGKEVPVSSLPTENLLYCSPQWISQYTRGLSRLPVKYTLVQVQERRVAKFLKHRPKALPFHLVYKMHIKKLEDAFTAIPDYQRVLMGTNDAEFFCRIYHESVHILDPEVNEAIKIAKTKADPIAKRAYQEYQSALNEVNWSYTYRSHFKKLSLKDLLEDKYPLLKPFDIYDIGHSDRDRIRQHIVCYLNAAYLTLPSKGEMAAAEAKEAAERVAAAQEAEEAAKHEAAKLAELVDPPEFGTEFRATAQALLEEIIDPNSPVAQLARFDKIIQVATNGVPLIPPTLPAPPAAISPSAPAIVEDDMPF